MYKIETVLNTTSWVGYGRTIYPSFIGETLEEALDKLYEICCYSPKKKINELFIKPDWPIYDKTTTRKLIGRCADITFNPANYKNGWGYVNIIRYIDENNNCIIFENDKYVGSKCKIALENYLEKLDNIIAKNSIHGDF